MRRHCGSLALAAAVGGALLVVASRPAVGQAPAVTRLTTQASGPVTRRGQISDTAQLSGAVGGAASGTLTFSVYGPGDPTCARTPAAVTTRTVSGDGGYASDPYVAPTAGVYRWSVRYSGDAANAPVASGCGGPGETVAVTDPPPPVLGRSFQVGPLSGRIYVMVPPSATAARALTKGVGFVPLPESRTLPFGSVIDARAGVARITSAAASPGQVQVGDFGAGRFRVLASRSVRGLTELDLVVGRAAVGTCTAQATTAAARPLPKKVLALLRSSATGRFSARGRFSSATVRGTAWETIDRCDGTLTRVTRGVVLVTDFRRARNIVVRAGKSYLARA